MHLSAATTRDIRFERPLTPTQRFTQTHPKTHPQARNRTALPEHTQANANPKPRALTQTKQTGLGKQPVFRQQVLATIFNFDNNLFQFKCTNYRIK